MTKRIAVTPPSGQDADAWLAKARVLALFHKQDGHTTSATATAYIQHLIEKDAEHYRERLESPEGRAMLEAETSRFR